MMRRRVDFPQPEGPTMVINSPDIGQVFDGEADVLKRELGLGAVAKGLGDVLEGDHVRRRQSCCWLAEPRAGPRAFRASRAAERRLRVDELASGITHSSVLR